MEGMIEVLVVEDAFNVGDFVVRLLARRGYGATLVRSRAEAFVALAREPRRFALAFVDIGLPDGSGLDVVAEARRSSPGMPVILTTGCLGAVDAPLRSVVLAKPFTVEAFAEAIDAGLSANSVSA
jgi:DNA-binding NtrC family response regulator